MYRWKASVWEACRSRFLSRRSLRVKTASINIMGTFLFHLFAFSFSLFPATNERDAVPGSPWECSADWYCCQCLHRHCLWTTEVASQTGKGTGQVAKCQPASAVAALPKGVSVRKKMRDRHAICHMMQTEVIMARAFKFVTRPPR